MMLKKLVSILMFLFVAGQGFSQSVQSRTLAYTPEGNGYELNIPFKWKFINCYGEVHVTITKNSKDITSNAYIYNGKRYTQSELGAESFSKPECGLTDIMVDLYDGSYRLGEAKLGNVIDWLGGCFGQTYHITELIGLSDDDYKEKLASLSLKNIRFIQVSSRDYGLEGKIKEFEKGKSLESKLSEADAAFSAGNLENAKDLYGEALDIDYSNAHAKSKIDEIEKRLKENKEKEALEEQKQKAQELYDAGDYEAAKSAFEKALAMNPNDSEAQSMLATINEKLEAEKERREAEEKENEENAEKEKALREKKEAAVAAASNRRHKGFFWGRDPLSKGGQVGSPLQETNLMGLFKVEYDLWSLSGEVAHRFKFYWEWSNALRTGYPQFVSVLGDQVVHIAEFKKYPGLLERWNNIKPLYVEIECDILNFKNGDEYVADTGTIKIIPEAIGKSGEHVDWSLPGSPSWNELFTYTNGMKWDYFRDLGLYEEIDEYADEFSNDIAWPKYAFEYSDNIDFFTGHNYFSSEFTTLSDKDYDFYSSSASVSKVVWPVEEILALIEEFEVLEKRAEEEEMDAKDFWSTAENDEKSEAGDFWETPNNSKTVEDVKRERIARESLEKIEDRTGLISNARKKYEMLKNPFKITSHKTNSTVEKGRITLKGNLHPYLKQTGRVFVSIDEEEFKTSTSSGSFSSNIILSEGWNDIVLKIKSDDFGFKEEVRIFYKKPPPLPCNETVTGGSGYQVKEHGIGTENGTFTINWDLFSAYDEFSVYAAPKERTSSSNKIFSHSGYNTGKKSLTVKNLEGGIITIIFNGDGGGSGWEYNLDCPNQ